MLEIGEYVDSKLGGMIKGEVKAKDEIKQQTPTKAKQVEIQITSQRGEETK